MKRAVTVPPAARSAFAKALSTVSSHAAALPDPLPAGRVLRLVDRSSDSDEEMTVFAGESDTGHYLDYYRVGNDGQTTFHGRIRDDGTFEELENYEGEYGWPVFPNDPEKTAAEHQRMIAHNTRVEAILRAKGFK